MIRLDSIIVLLIMCYCRTESQKNRSVRYYEDMLREFSLNSAKYKYPTSSREFFKENVANDSVFLGDFDFVVVGAGIGGSVVSSRLTESDKFTVLLLEAGGKENDLTDIPGVASLLVRSDFNWGYKTIPQTNCCLGMKNRRCNYPRGKALGGSSVINFMVYVRGNKEDFDRWGAENPGWEYENVLPYFKLSENSTVTQEDPGYHGHDGSLSVEHVRYYPPMTNLFLEAVQEMNRTLLDYNGKNQMGYSHIQSTTKDGRRCSSYKAFLKAAMSRRNLRVIDHALVVKVLIENKRAYGVEFLKDGKRYKATASKEVIVSGGSINSPQLLMLSGIGPKEHLQELGIPLVKDLPVGQALQDHLIFPALIFSTNLTADFPDMPKNIRDYIDGHGILTAASALTGIGFASPRIKSGNPSVEYAFMSALREQMAPFLMDFLEMTEENWEAISNALGNKLCWGIVPILLHPKSTGTIKLKSADPLEFPLMDSNLYSDRDDDDMMEMLSIIEDVFRISHALAFRRIDSKYESARLPACIMFPHLSEEYWRCALKQISYPILHAVSTCRMGPETDKMAVVDSNLKVYGIDSLRVIDASVMPFSIASHPAPSTYMIAEKGSNIIRNYYGDV